MTDTTAKKPEEDFPAAVVDANEIFTDKACELINKDRKAAVEYAIQMLYLVRKSMIGYALSDYEKYILADKEGFKKRLAQARLGLIALLYDINETEDW